MKLTMYLFLFSLFQLYANTYSQNAKVTLELNDVTIEEVLTEIEEQTEFKVLYNHNDYDYTKLVTVEVENALVTRVLDEIFTNTNIKYKTINKQIVLLKNSKKGTTALKVNRAQIKLIKGVVTDSAGEPLPGASVIEKGTTYGTVTDFDGNFTMKRNNKNMILVISYVGYKTQEIPVLADQTSITIQLEEDTASLDEIVIVGYGSQVKSQVTGAISTVDSKKMNEKPVASVDRAIQGMVPGVNVSTNNSTPGGGASVRIRGAGSLNNSEPLYVIDGIPFNAGESTNSSPLSFINPNDIENISILKDAASGAIYGARAANGVILITTKKGKKGVSTLNINSSYGIQRIANKLDLMSASEWANWRNQRSILNGGSAIFSDPASLGAGTDWIDATTTVAPMQNHQISYSSGSEKGSVFTSLGYFNQEGVVKGTGFERYTFRVNAEYQILDRLKIGTNTDFRRSEQTSFGGGSRTVITSGPTYYAHVFYPTLSPRDENGNYTGTPNDAAYQTWVNPLFTLENQSPPPVDTSIRSRVYFDLDITSNLSFKTSLAYTYFHSKSDVFNPYYSLGQAVNADPSVQKTQNYNGTFLIENVLSYKLKKDEHKLDVDLGQSSQKTEGEVLGVLATYANNTEPQTQINGAATTYEYTNRFIENSLASYFGRVNYSFNNRYIFTLTGRYDGSSKFGNNKKWGFFPSVSAAWRISQEEFFPQNSVVNSLKLRGGWGQVGFDEIPSGIIDSQYTLQNWEYPLTNTDEVRQVGAGPLSIVNPDAQWETVTQYGAGLEASLFDNSLEVSVEYYNKKRTDMFLQVPVSGISGLTGKTRGASQFENIGELVDKGIEISVNYNKSFGDLDLSVGANISTVNNEITYAGPLGRVDGFSYNSDFVVRSQEGNSIFSFLGYQADGLFQSQEEVDNHATGQANVAPGDIRFKDINGDGVINDNDRTIIGKSVPDFYYGINLDLKYKNFDFSLQGNGTQGNDVLNLTKHNLIDATNWGNKIQYTPWTTENPNTPYPRINEQDGNNRKVSSFYVEDGSFFRINNIRLGYTVPKEMLKTIGLTNAYVYTNVSNPFTFTDYSGVDPEVGNTYNGNNRSQGVDQFVYPIARTFTMGVNLSF
ncbi:SusC/RagA family TonB-linked outer membrane protein [Wenyingzhuangia sp. IMCC45574]